MPMELPKEGIVKRYMKDQVKSFLSSPPKIEKSMYKVSPPDENGDWDSSIYE